MIGGAAGAAVVWLFTRPSRPADTTLGPQRASGIEATSRSNTDIRDFNVSVPSTHAGLVTQIYFTEVDDERALPQMIDWRMQKQIGLRRVLAAIGGIR